MKKRYEAHAGCRVHCTGRDRSSTAILEHIAWQISIYGHFLDVDQPLHMHQ